MSLSYHSLSSHKQQSLLPVARELFFWDFDGVLCDSVRETAKAGYLACLRLWPGEVGNGDGSAFSFQLDPPEKLIEAFRIVRPHLHTGWEAVVMVRLLLSSAVDMMEGAASVAERWSDDTCGACLQEWASEGEDVAAVQARVMDVFNAVRQEWIEADLEGWKGMHGRCVGVARLLTMYLLTATLSDTRVGYIGRWLTVLCWMCTCVFVCVRALGCVCACVRCSGVCFVLFFVVDRVPNARLAGTLPARTACPSWCHDALLTFCVHEATPYLWRPSAYSTPKSPNRRTSSPPKAPSSCR